MTKALAIAVALSLSPLPAQAFEIGFEWGALKSCTSGSPNTVDNPRFELTDVPEGTKFIRFKMVDLNYPSFNHGGGTIAYTGQTVIEPGSFKYKSPCPPTGQHKYQWTATAQSKKSGGKIDAAKAVRKYPE